MTRPSTGFRELADILDAITATDHSECVSITPDTSEGQRDGSYSLDLDIRVPLLTDEWESGATEITPQDVSLMDDGTLEVTLQVTAHTDTVDSDKKCADSGPVHDSNNTTEADGSDSTPATDSDSTEIQTSPDQDAAASLPTYRDPSQLQDVYEQHETFAEMTEALDVDVTPHTVRRYMIKHGIHTPRSSTTSTDTTATVTECDHTEETANTNAVQQTPSDGQTVASTRTDGGTIVQKRPSAMKAHSTPKQNGTTSDSPNSTTPTEAESVDSGSAPSFNRSSRSQLTDSLPVDQDGSDKQSQPLTSQSPIPTLQDRIVDAINRRL